MSEARRAESNGDGCTNRYYLFSITMNLRKKLEYANYGACQKRCETVYVREVNSLQSSDKEVETVVKR